MKGTNSRKRKILLVIIFLVYTIFITLTPTIITKAEKIDTTFTPRPNLPPDKPILIYPANGSTNITTPVILQVLVYDNTSQWVHVYFYNASDDVLIGHVRTESATIASKSWDGIKRGKNYSWYSVASDLEYTNTSAIWNFSTKPNSPPIIQNETPPNGSININLIPSCTIRISDNDSDLMNIYWYENTTGSWILRDVTGMVGDGNYSWKFWQATRYSTTYSWKVVVNDSYDETTAIFYFTTKAPPPNRPPIAVITGPTWGYVNQTLIFYGNDSYDRDGRIVGYRWDFNNDGSYDTKWNYSAIGTFNYSQPGNYTIKLQVIDNDGRTDTDTHNITILPLEPPLQLPIAEANGPYIVFINQTVNFSSNGSYDPDGNITNYTWYFGDNNTSYLENPTHIYSQPGNYTVILTVRDNDNLTNNDTANVYVKKIKEEDIKPPKKTKKQPLLWPIFLIILIITAVIALLLLFKRYKKYQKNKKLETIHKEIEKINIEGN
jgi:PKD repeat protein